MLKPEGTAASGRRFPWATAVRFWRCCAEAATTASTRVSADPDACSMTVQTMMLTSPADSSAGGATMLYMKRQCSIPDACRARIY